MALVDGDGEKIHARLNRNLVEVGCMLKIGDMIRLDLFTQLRFRINSGSPHMPMLFIHGLSRVGKDRHDEMRSNADREGADIGRRLLCY